MLCVHLLLLVHQHLPHTLWQGLVLGLWQPGAQETTGEAQHSKYEELQAGGCFTYTSTLEGL